MRLFLLLLILLPLRTWTDHTGKHTTEAELLDFKGGIVYLSRSGQIKSLSIARLSDDDQEYVRAAFPSEKLSGEVVGITDGDTITLLDESKIQHKIRLDGIDAPESHQDFGTQSRKSLGKKLIRKRVRIEWTSEDRYGRILGNVFLEGRWINLEQVTDGLAWQYKQYNHSAIFAAAEAKAREAKFGLWSQPDPIAPWDFRRQPQQRGPPGGGRRPDKPVVPVDPDSPSPIAGRVRSQALGATSDDTSDETIYITDTGTRYHRPGCKYLIESSTPLSLSEAQGLYTPCKICHPELVIPKPEKRVAVKRPRRSYNRPRQTVQIGPSIPAPYALGGGGGGGGSGGPVHVRGYTRRDGTYVAPHTRRAPSR